MSQFHSTRDRGKMSSIKFNPPTLKRLCVATINKSVGKEPQLRQLDLPRVCIRDLEEHYFTDNLWCDDKLAPIDMDQYPYDHSEPFMQLSNDEFLSIQRYDEVPWFAHERNHVHKMWFEVDWNNEPICWQCALKANKNPDLHGHTLYRISSCFTAPAERIIEAMQGLDMWCTNCFTVSLFWISEYVFHSSHFPEDYTREIDIVHRIENKNQ